MSIQRRAADTVVRTLGTTTTRTTSIGQTRRSTPTAGSVSDPRQLARGLQELSGAIDKATAMAASRDDLGGITYRDLTFTAGETKRIAHGLGHAYVDWRWSRPRGGTVDIQEQTPTVAFPADKFLSITSTNACTVNVRVW